MARQDQAQAQKQKQNTISYSESLELVRCLLRVSVFHISYLRGLFPDEHFKGVDMHNLDGMNIKMLVPACEESRRLIDWVEGGVYDAIRRGFLKALYFGIAVDPEGTSLLEEYIFNFNYSDDDGQVTLELVQRNGKTGAKKSLHEGSKSGSSVEAVKYQVTRLMRMLVQICQTLDKVPHERYLFMKLTYHNHTPDDYEPPYFVPVEGGGGVGHFARKPFTMEVGKVATNHHGLTMKIKSTLDSCEDGDESIGEPEEVASGGATRATDMDEDVVEGGHNNNGNGNQKAPGGQAQQPSCSVTFDAAGAQKQSKPSSQVEQELPGNMAAAVSAPDYEAVKGYVVRCLETSSQLDLADALAVFLDISGPTLEAIFTRLQRDGVITPDERRPDRFRPGTKTMQHKEGDKLASEVQDRLAVQAKAPPAPHQTKAPAPTAAQQEGGASAGAAAGGGGGGVGGGGVSDTVQTRDQRRKAVAGGGKVLLPSQDAMEVVYGSEATGNGRANPKASGAAAGAGRQPGDTQAPGNLHFEEGLRSGAGQGDKPRARKASFVADPIHQKPQKPAKKTRRGA